MRWRVALVAALLIGCAGPVPSGSPAGGNETIDPSIPPTAAGTSLASAAPSPSVGPSNPATVAPTARPTSRPTFTPDPTPEGALPLRTEVEVNADIVDRPGVPADLYDTYWWTDHGDAGQVGTTAQIGLPAGERILTAANGLVVSARPVASDGNRHEPVALVVRDIKTGSILRELATNTAIPSAFLVGNRLVWTGMEAGHGAGPAVDGGVWSADVNTTSNPIEIVPPGKEVDSALAGRYLRASGSGRTIAAILSMGFGGRWVDIIDVESQDRRARLRNVTVVAVTDDMYIADDGPPRDGIFRGYGVTAYDIQTSERRWGYPDAVDAERFFIWAIRPFASVLALQYSWRTPTGLDWITATIDPSTGARRVLNRRSYGEDNPHLQSGIASASHLALANDEIGYLIGIGGTTISILDVATGSMTTEAFVIDPPWLCFSEYCLRD